MILDLVTPDTLLTASIGLLVGCGVAAWLRFGANLTKTLESFERLGRSPEGL